MKSQLRKAGSSASSDFAVKGLSPEIIQRLREAIRDAGGNKAVAEKAGLPLSTLNDALGGVSQPRASAMAAIAAATGKSLDWLMLLSGGPRLTAEAAEDVLHVERLAFAGSAGSGTLVIEDTAGTIPVPKALLQRLHLRPEHARMLESSGDSMLPTIAHGDPLLVDISPDARANVVDNRIYAFTIGNEAFLKRLRREPGQLIMVSDNAAFFPPRPVPAGEPFRIIGRVCWGAREL